MMKIIFNTTRMHTNTYGATKALLGRGDEVAFHVTYIGKTEDHSLVSPVVLPQSLISKLIGLFFGDGGDDKRLVFPSFYCIFRLLQNEAANVVVIRNP